MRGKALSYGANPLTDMWESGNVDATTASEFTELMDIMMAYPADVLSKSEKFKKLSALCDVGGGSGAWALALRKNQSHMKVTIFDLPTVINKTKQLLTMKSTDDAIELFPGNFFTTQIPSSPAYLLSNILHDWPENKCKDILQNISKSAPKGSKLFINECLLNETESGPEFTTFFSLLMAVNHGSKQFTHGQLTHLLRTHSFSHPRVIGTCGYYYLTVSEKK